MSSDFLLKKPRSKKREQDLAEAYGKLSEQNKIWLLKTSHKLGCWELEDLVEGARLVRGASLAKVLNRSSGYGPKIDRYLTSAKGQVDLKLICFAAAREAKQAVELVQQIPQGSDESQALAEVGRYIKTNRSDPVAVLLGRFFSAYINFAGQDFTAVRDQSEVIFAAETDVAFSTQSEPAQARDLLADLDASIDSLRQLTDEVANAQVVDADSWSKALTRANEIIDGITQEVSRLQKVTGAKPRQWRTRGELADLLAELRQLAEAADEKSKIAPFLKELARQVAQLLPKHKLAVRRQAHERMRNDSVVELNEAADSATPRWITVNPTDAGAWLPWLLSLNSEELEGVIHELSEAQYPKTAELCAELEAAFEIPGSVAQTPDKLPSDSGKTSSTIEMPAAQKHEAAIEEAAKSTDIPLRVEARKNDGEGDAVAEKPKDEIPKIEKKVTEAIREEQQPKAEAAEKSVPVYPVRDIKQAARLVSEANDHDIELHTGNLIWALLANNERQLAFQLLKAAIDKKGMTDAFILPPAILEIIALSPFASADAPDVIERVRFLLSPFYGDFSVEGQRVENLIRAFLVAAAVFYPALQGPAVNGARILRTLKLGKLPSVQSAQSAVQEFSSTELQINPTILSAALNAESWGDQENQLVDDLRAFREAAPKRAISFVPAQRVWRNWFARNGMFTELFNLGESHSGKSIEQLRQRLDTLNLSNEIDRAWRQEERRPGGNGPARVQVQRFAEDAIRRLQRRVDHHASNPEVRNDHRRSAIHKLKKAFQNIGKNAAHDVNEYVGKDHPNDTRLRIAGELLAAELGRLEQTLDGAGSRTPCTDIDLALNADLLRLVDFPLREDWTPAPAGDVFEALVKRLCSPLPSWEEAFRAALAERDHLSARRILDRLSGELAQDALEALEEDKASRLKSDRAAISREIDAVQSELVASLAKGWLEPEAYSDMNSRIQLLRQKHADPESSPDQPYNIWARDLAEIRSCIEAGRAKHVRQLQAELDKLQGAEEEDLARIRQALEQNDVSLASDYISQLREEGSIQPRTESVKGTMFSDFFSDNEEGSSRANKLHAYVTSTSFRPVELLKRVEAGQEVEGLALLDQQQRREAREGLNLWFEWSRDPKGTEQRLAEVIQRLGFPLPKVSRRSTGSHDVSFDTPVECPVPDFGSELNGKLHVMCDFKSTTAEDALGAIARHKAAGKPTLLLWFKPVSAATRRAFARICKDRAYKVLLVDTVLAMFVLLRGSEKLRALFECSLPFSYVSPYCTAGGVLPDEMFFGRRAEMREIESASPNGAFLVYGGRQIGKTVLLKKVAKEFESASKRHISLFIDLNKHPVGTETTIDEIWRIMATELDKKDPAIFASAMKGQAGSKVFAETFEDRIKTWLAKDSERRILVLLDEADALLTADGESDVDGQQFKFCHQVKGLMDSTERRFKIVFAGLHDVQRTTRVPNSPLFHLGRPICVRPLMSNGEAKEAFRLVAEPILSCGGDIDQMEMSVNTILAQTNYYPNLIQIVSDRLLKTAVDRQLLTNKQSCPPFKITPELVETVLNMRDVRDELHKKLLITLDLDKRYCLIAYVVAYHRTTKPEGMTPDEIREQAHYWWEAGFKPDPRVGEDEERYQFKILLEEMCNLGVLRQNNELFALRSPNVAALLGTIHDVESVLMAAPSWDAPAAYSPETFRGFDRRGNISPLTAAQEHRLLNEDKHVFVIVGTPAAGINRVVERLRDKAEEDYFRQLEPRSTQEQFMTVLSELKESRREKGKTLLIVPASCSWDFDWISKAQAALRRLSSETRMAGVVFLADPVAVWSLSHQWDSFKEHLVRLSPCSKRALKKFVENTNKLLYNTDTTSLMEKATGLWHEPLLFLKGAIADHAWKDEWMRDGTFRKQLLSAHNIINLFGIHDDERLAVLKALSEGGVCSPEDLTEYLAEDGELTRAQITKVLTWATALGIANNGDEGLRLDPFVDEFLKSA